MRRQNKLWSVLVILLSGLSCLAVQANPQQLPNGFVYLKDIEPTITQDIRYATAHNFIGHPVAGYGAGECILTRQTALALAQIQKQLAPLKLSLKVYDCYRPQVAVNEFIAWSKLPGQQQMKAEFYPRVDKADFFKLGYVAAKSGHTRGSTVDLTITALPLRPQQTYKPGQQLVACVAPYVQRFHDGGIDMGTGFDCMDQLSHNDNTSVSTSAWKHRMLLKQLMERYGFVAYQPEWWHFTLKNEPYSDTYFNFPITGKH